MSGEMGPLPEPQIATRLVAAAVSRANSAATTALLDALNIRLPTILMLLSFVGGTILTIATGFYL